MKDEVIQTSASFWFALIISDEIADHCSLIEFLHDGLSDLNMSYPPTHIRQVKGHYVPLSVVQLFSYI